MLRKEVEEEMKVFEKKKIKRQNRRARARTQTNRSAECIPVAYIPIAKVPSPPTLQL